MATQTTARRSFPDDLKREAVSLTGIQRSATDPSGNGTGHSALNAAQLARRDERGSVKVSAARGSVTTAPSAEQFEILRLRRDLKRARMERDILKNYRGPAIRLRR